MNRDKPLDEMSDAQIIMSKTAALVNTLGWDRLEGLSTKSALEEIKGTYERCLKDSVPQKAGLVAGVKAMLEMANKYDVA
jgi:hypothetical protein